MRLDCIKIENYTNLWYEIDRKDVGDDTYYLMENQTWGDETCCLVIKKPKKFQDIMLKNGNKVIWIPADHVICETFDDIETALIDEGVI